MSETEEECEFTLWLSEEYSTSKKKKKPIMLWLDFNSFHLHFLDLLNHQSSRITKQWFQKKKHASEKPIKFPQAKLWLWTLCRSTTSIMSRLWLTEPLSEFSLRDLDNICFCLLFYFSVPPSLRHSCHFCRAERGRRGQNEIGLEDISDQCIVLLFISVMGLK